MDVSRQTTVHAVVAVVIASVAACGPDLFHPVLDIPIAPVGKTRSPPFRISTDDTYNIMIGLDSMKVDEATCAAAYVRQPGVTHPPCNKLTPPYGPIMWTVMQGGKIVARGSMDASPAALTRAPASWAMDKTMSWDAYSGWSAHPGSDYIIEINVQPSAIDLAQFHPRLAIIKPFG
jgi:hypothetical protein